MSKVQIRKQNDIKTKQCADIMSNEKMHARAKMVCTQS